MNKAASEIGAACGQANEKGPDDVALWSLGSLMCGSQCISCHVALRHPQSMKIAWFDSKLFVSSGRFGNFRSRARLSAVPLSFYICYPRRGVLSQPRPTAWVERVNLCENPTFRVCGAAERHGFVLKHLSVPSSFYVVSPKRASYPSPGQTAWVETARRDEALKGRAVGCTLPQSLSKLYVHLIFSIHRGC